MGISLFKAIKTEAMGSRGMLVFLGLIALFAASARGATFTPFGPRGEGGRLNGQTFTMQGADIFEVDAYLVIDGLDLNGSDLGVSAQLSTNPLPPGLGYSFSSNVSTDQTDVTLTYTITNETSGIISNLQFFFLVDVEIDQTTNTFF